MYPGFEYNLKLLINFYETKLKCYILILVSMLFLFIVILLDQTFYSNKFAIIFIIVYSLIALKTYVNIYYIFNLDYILDCYMHDVERVETKLRKKLYKIQHSLTRVNARLYTYYLILYSNLKSKQ